MRFPLHLRLLVPLVFSVQCQSIEKPFETITDHPKTDGVQIRDALNWLPPDCETLVLSRKRLKIPAPELKPPYQDGIFYLQTFYFGDVIQDSVGDNVLIFSLEGSRNFRSPAALGAAPYDGCHILVLEKPIDELSFPVNASSFSEEFIQGVTVFVRSEKRERDLWTDYFFMLEPRVLVYATDREFATELIERHGRSRTRETHFENLKEWNFVDSKAEFIALTRLKTKSGSVGYYDHAALLDDKNSIGVIVSVRDGLDQRCEIKYLSSDPNASADYGVLGFLKVKKEIQELPDGGLLISSRFDDTEEDHRALLYFGILAMLGHGIII
jgi:hypothetical protein